MKRFTIGLLHLKQLPLSPAALQNLVILDAAESGMLFNVTFIEYHIIIFSTYIKGSATMQRW